MGAKKSKCSFDRIWKDVSPQLVRDPYTAWEQLSAKQKVRKVRGVSRNAAKAEGHTRFVCISDTHSKTDRLDVPEGDVLLHSGDFSRMGRPDEVQKFNEFLGRLPHRYKIVIAGNHELTFDVASFEKTSFRFLGGRTRDSEAVRALLTNCIYLQDEATEVLGFKIYGSPWQPEFCDWAFNLPRGKALQDKWAMIPNDIDILMTHGPPIGHGDLCFSGDRAGCVDLLREIQTRIKPKYHVFGHIHEGYGMTTDGQTVFVNASTCSYQYTPTQPPIVFDLPGKRQLKAK